jgi:hypothetical protein
MSSFFDKIMNDAKGLEEKLLGPDYPYYKYIATPAELNITSDGSLSATSDDIEGLLAYVQMMVEGTGKANTVNVNRPLGDKFFLKTGAQCMDNKTQQLVDRYIWINNVPDGSIPFLTGATGITFTEFEGLVPGIMEDLGALNPLDIFKGFMEGNNPPCTEITLPTIGQPPGGNSNPNVEGESTLHVSDDDIKNIPACTWGSSGVNPITSQSCKETFVPARYPAEENYNNLYILLCALLMVFILQKLLKRN